MPNKSDPRVIINHLHVNCARAFAIYKTIYEYKNDSILQENYWRVVANSSQETAVIQWCGLFGSKDKNNKTHWMNSGVSGIKDRNEFKTKILSKIPISFEEWKIIHNSILIYRNKNVAHIDLDDWQRDVPYFDQAIEVLFCSYDILFDNKNLREEYQRTVGETRAVIQKHRNES
jgi:hypothetical protein